MKLLDLWQQIEGCARDMDLRTDRTPLYFFSHIKITPEDAERAYRTQSCLAAEAQVAEQRRQKASPRRQGPSPKVAKRREKVARLQKLGFSQRDISEKLGVSEALISQDVKANIQLSKT